MNRPLIVILLGLAILLAGCGRLSRETGPAGQYGVPRATAVFLAGGQPQTLDPALTRGGPDSALGHIFSGLVTLDPALQVQPELAAGWTVSPDGLTYTFYLRRHAVFHNGRPVTAHDVIFAWERATDPALGSDTAATYLGDIAGVADRLAGRSDRIAGLRAVDDHTLEVRIDAPKLYFLAKLTYPVAYVVDREQVSDPGWGRQPNGTGPFRLHTWRDDEILILARHDAYYGTPASVSHVVYLLGAGLPLSLYETDQIDLVGVGGSTLARMEDPNNPLSRELVTGVSMCTSTIGLNNRERPFDDPRVRQAFNLAIDRERLITALYDGNALPAHSPLPPGMPGYGAGATPAYAYDPERARQLLAEAGYGDGLPPLIYTSSGYDAAGPLVSAVVTMWQAALDVDITVELVEPFAYLDALYAGRTGHLFNSGWCADYPDPENFLDVLYHSQSAQNLGRYRSADVDRLLEAARTEPDVSRRLAQYNQVEQLIIADAPAVYLSHGLQAVLIKPRLQGYQLSPIGVAQWHRVRLVE